MLTVDISRRCESTADPDNALLVRWAQAGWQEPTRAAEVALVIIDQDAMQAFNAKYRDKDKPTNVLSFPAGFENEEGVLNLGDILLCAPVIERESQEQHKRNTDHWAHMTIHGMLHLQGYDHEHREEAETMENLEVEILNQLGIANPYHANQTQ